ncbi:tRNA (adenosine(37)-N6)-threonylcarbamoyltransferase complex dimerization subunit type 1 TsaB [Parabacteroides bouchesdurhonensis]|uniref:tRNA (adenosine(37)-N6)-threonylcarbamoyltransferase complex dimerization subunit type 1 TsaB n=1 Tax=Parabacteroides bouchesdurhonensis TaxID=1936995 RepID=UPI000C8187CC|nr:tRNA (adenosine(37)-N6)-threonylcarbamoyltransferase complex dimerization subunit type 1 TsaB [Parabacteroides bouchesdurhonensis]
MSCILNIETSTSVCSVALSMDGQVLFEKTSYEGPSHAVLLGVYVEEAIAVAKKKGVKLSAVAVSSGPGSYTGLRIGVSVAKGLCFGYDIPLISIHTLDILTIAALKLQKEANDRLYCAMLDARRMEVYAAIYNSGLEVIRGISADIVNADTYMSYLEKDKVCFFGNGAEKCKSIITSPNALFMDNIYPLAVNMIPLSERAFIAGAFEDVAYFEPFYLKEFQATIAKNKVLGSNV